MLGQTSSPILGKAEQAIMSKVPAQLRADLSKVMSAGMQILYAPQLSGQLRQKLASTDPVQSAAQGAVNLMGELWKQSRFQIPKPLIVPALLLFAFEYLDLAQKSGKLQVTAQIVAQVTKLATDKFLALTKGQPGAQAPAGAPASPASPAAPAGQPPAASAPAGIINGAAAQGAQ